MKKMLLVLLVLLSGCATTYHPERDLECTIRAELGQQNINWQGRNTEFTATTMALLDWWLCMTGD